MLHSRASHTPFSKVHREDRIGYSIRSQLISKFCRNRAGDSQASSLCGRRRFCGCIRCPLWFTRKSWLPPSRADASATQCSRTVLRCCSTPWSGTVPFQFQLSNSGEETFARPTSYSCTTFGWRTFFKILISRDMRSMSFLSLILAFSRILIATCTDQLWSTYMFVGKGVRCQFNFAECALAKVFIKYVGS